MCVDEGVADLLVACWDAGIDTTSSCQDAYERGPKHDPAQPMGLLGLANERDMQRFAELMLNGLEPADDHARHVRSFDHGTWEWHARPYFHACSDEHPLLRVQRIAYWVIFPMGDMPFILERLGAGCIDG